MAFVIAQSAPLLTTWLNKKFVSDLEWALQYQKFTTKAEIPKGAGQIGSFTVWKEPSIGTAYSGSGNVALTEATTTGNEITSITTAATTITIAEFGEFVKIGSLLEYAAVAGAREKILKRMGDGAAMGIDDYVRSKAIPTTKFLVAATGATGGVVDTTATGTATVQTAGAALIMLARKQVMGAGARGFMGIPGHPDGQYAAVISPKQELDIITEVTTGRIYWSNSVTNVPGVMGQEKFVNGYIGSIYGCAVYTTQNYTTASITASCEIGYLLADGGLGAMSFGDMAPSIVINDVNSPYKNVNSIAWHVNFGAALIASARVIKLYSIT
jgi:hypothetical protein